MTARRHHFIPEFYLAGFTLSGSKDDFLWVLDQEQVQQWKAKPSKTGHQRDFYRVDLPDGAPDGLEIALGHVEGQVAPVLKRVIEAKTRLSADDLLWLINFISLMDARVPYMRNKWSSFIDEVYKKRARNMVVSREQWRATFDNMREKGEDISNDVSYEQMKSFIEDGKYTIDMDQNWHMRNLLNLRDKILRLLVKREWCLLIAEEDGCEFICSDNPVALEWGKPMNGPYPPGFGHAGTMVTMPLNKDLALMGRFEGPAGVFPADCEVVAMVNSLTGSRAERFIYSPHEDFIWIKKDRNTIGNVADLLHELKTR